MSSEYLTWLARNEKPEEKRELTPKERRANWWHYNKIWVFTAIAAAALLFGLVRDMRQSALNTPDCQIGYVGTYSLPEDTIAALQESLSPLIGDQDGNGTAIVHVNQYQYSAYSDRAMDSNEQMVLTTHLATDSIDILLLEDPEAFQKQFGALTVEEGDTPVWYRWSECSVLTSLPLDSASQEVLADLYITKPYQGADQTPDPIWQILTGKK